MKKTNKLTDKELAKIASEFEDEQFTQKEASEIKKTR